MQGETKKKYKNKIKKRREGDHMLSCRWWIEVLNEQEQNVSHSKRKKYQGYQILNPIKRTKLTSKVPQESMVSHLSEACADNQDYQLMSHNLDFQ